MSNHHFKTSYMPIYQGNSYKLSAIKVYPVGQDSFEIENKDPSTGQRFSNEDFLDYVEQVFFKQYNYTL